MGESAPALLTQPGAWHGGVSSMQDGRMTAIGYTRVSTHEQADRGAGLVAQRTAIEAECARRGWILERHIEDAGYSAASLKRPGITEAIALLDRGVVGAIIVAK